MKSQDTWFEVQQGIWSPRDQDFSFRAFEIHSDGAMAIRRARALKPARVVKVSVVASFGTTVEKLT